MSSRNSSTSSTSTASSKASRASVPQTQSQQQPSARHVSSVCYPKGKWYDCLRPTTTPYQGFGSITNFANASGKQTQPEVGENWTREIYAKMR